MYIFFRESNNLQHNNTHIKLKKFHNFRTFRGMPLQLPLNSMALGDMSLCPQVPPVTRGM